jgi:progressive ankylosis protein
MPSSLAPTHRVIFLFWVPLALQWIMMALEGPFLAAVIARLADPTYNLAAYGVAFAFAILVESPVIMLMSASTALVENQDSYRRLRRFAQSLNAIATGLLVLLLIPAVFSLVLRAGLGLPDPVADRVYISLWILLPWPAAIGYRRFLHGVMIRAGRTRQVALGTLVRLITMASTALVLARLGVPGAWVGAGALSSGVVVEALAARIMARQALRELPDVADDPNHQPLSLGTMAQFYYPLALTSFIGLTTQPILTFFMGRSPSPVQSLALFPVVMAVYFVFGTFGLSFQEAAIALLGRNGENRKILQRFAAVLAMVASGILALLAFTPLAGFWFERVAGLNPEMAALAITPARLIAILPALTVATGFQRARLVRARKTRLITMASALEISTLALLFPLLGWGLGWMGVTAAMGALVGGRTVGATFLLWKVGRSGH